MKNTVEKMIKEHITNPWAVFQDIDETEIEWLTDVAEKYGIERVEEILRDDSVRGFHAEEYANDCL